MAGENITEKKKQESKNTKRLMTHKNYAFKKRLPVRPIDGNNVIFVTKKTNFKVWLLHHCVVIILTHVKRLLWYFQAQLEKCCDLLTRGEKEIILHGLGAAIQRCCNLALQLEILFSGTCQIEVNTGTVDLVGKN